MALGFTTYTDESIVEPPTLAEMLAALTGVQKTAILDGYADKIPPGNMKQVAPKRTVVHLYMVMEDIELTCRQYMRGEVVLDPGPPPTYNTPPASMTALKTLIAPLMVAKYSDAFTQTQVNAVIDKILLVSRKNASGEYDGTFSTYEAGVQA